MFRTSSNAWYVTLNGRKISLGVFGRKARKLALEAWHRLIAGVPNQNVGVSPARQSAPTVKGVVDAFLADAEARVSPAQVAALLGHSGTAMLHRHYAHLTARSKALRDALQQVRPSGN